MIKISFVNNPKAVVTGIIGATGITTPSVIASQNGREVTVLAKEVSEVKIDLENEQNNLLTITNDYNKWL